MWEGSIKLDNLTVPLRICPAAVELPTPHALGVSY